jgi:serine/threonine protein kinase
MVIIVRCSNYNVLFILAAMNNWLYGQAYHLYGTNKGLITTFSALVIKSTKAYLFHIGDSRIYRLRDGVLKCLTQDHRVQVSKEKQYLSRALGIELHVKIDYRELAVEEGDQFIFCTNGIYEYVSDNLILESIIENDFLYSATEYIEGQTLRQWMNDNPKASLVETREIVKQIKNGLRAFHRMEMIHQDIKPENIMIDQHGTVKIIDFGSTKIAGLEEITTPMERTNLLGIKNYTAPEYLLGYSGSVQTDVFSLGVIKLLLETGT